MANNSNDHHHKKKEADDEAAVVDVLVEEEEVVDDWGLPCDFHLFAEHQAHPVYIINTPIALSSKYNDEQDVNADDDNGNSSDDSNTKTQKYCCIQILCVEELTPIDMVQLGSGIHDATGHCVWTGAFWFIRTLGELQRRKYFKGKCVLELGCGTGLAGIAISKTCTPEHVIFTDADPEALALCRRNCELNKLDKNRYTIQELVWGEQQQNNPQQQHPINGTAAITTSHGRIIEDDSVVVDTIIATDVLYDIGMLTPIIQTATRILCNCRQGHFILAHVPRACYNTEHPPIQTNLEDYIIQQFEQESSHFVLECILRPSDDYFQQQQQQENNLPDDALNCMSLEEMHDIGAAVLVFKKQNNCTTTAGNSNEQGHYDYGHDSIM